MPGGFGSLGERGIGGPAGERIAPGIERLPPVRHRAAGVGVQDPIEGAVALLPPERVEHSHGVLEALPSLRRAGDRKNHSTQFSDLMLVVVLLRVQPSGLREGYECCGEHCYTVVDHGMSRRELRVLLRYHHRIPRRRRRR